jgi:hypothetical protein
MGRSGFLAAGATIAGFVAFATNATPSEPPPHSVVGTWQLASIYEEDGTGEDSPMFGFNPAGLLVLDAAGHFSLQIVDDLQWNKECHRANAMGPRAKAGPAMLAYFGSYVIDPDGGSSSADGAASLGTIQLHVDHGLHLNWEKPDRTADVTVSGDRMEFVSSIAPTPTGASYSRLVWQRLR